MIEQYDDESRDGDETIWRDAVTLSPDDTKDAKVHITLRLDPNVYRAIVAEKKAAKERTITSTIERLLSKGLQGGTSPDEGESALMRSALRNLVAHSVVQDTILEMISRHLKPRSSRDRELIEEFRKYSCAQEDAPRMKQWLDRNRYDAIGNLNLLVHLFDMSPAVKSDPPNRVPAQTASKSRRAAKAR